MLAFFLARLARLRTNAEKRGDARCRAALLRRRALPRQWRLGFVRFARSFAGLIQGVACLRIFLPSLERTTLNYYY